MSTSLRLKISDYEQMIANGAFVGLNKRLEFVDGEIREMSSGGPYHYDCIEFLLRWSTSNTTVEEASIQVQAAILLGNSLPEPDVMWLKPKRYRGQRPTADDALLIIEVADSSLQYDLSEKASLYSRSKINEYWVVDIGSHCIHRHLAPSGHGYQDVCKFERTQNISPRCKTDAQLVLAELFDE